MKVAIVCADTGTVGQRIAELLLNAKPGEVTIIPTDLAVAWQAQIADRTAPAILSIRKRERQAWATLRDIVLD